MHLTIVVVLPVLFYVFLTLQLDGWRIEADAKGDNVDDDNTQHEQGDDGDDEHARLPDDDSEQAQSTEDDVDDKKVSNLQQQQITTTSQSTHNIISLHHINIAMSLLLLLTTVFSPLQVPRAAVPHVVQPCLIGQHTYSHQHIVSVCLVE
jgi:hypothetical protein